MKSDSQRQGPRLSWHESAEQLIERIPGVASAIVEGPRHSVSEVRIWYEPTWPVGQLIEAVQECLAREVQARLTATRFHAVVARPDRRTERRTRPEGLVSAPVAWRGVPDAPLRLVGHKVEELRDGVVGVEVWIEWLGRTFNGAAMGPDVPPGSLRTPALATLRAIHACLQVLYQGPHQPGLLLENVLQVAVEGSPVMVVALTASENARPRQLTSAWADQGGTDLAVILATLHAASRTVTRWLGEEHADPAGPVDAPPTAEGRPDGGGRGARLTLLDVDVGRRPEGDLDVGVRLSGFGEAVDRRRTGRGESALLGLGAEATLDAIHELLERGGWQERHHGDLRHAGSHRLRTGELDVVVVLADALMNGHRVPLVGATPVEGGVERASIKATLQATNTLVAERAAAILRAGGLPGTPPAKA